jgi:hypothetical protein
MYTKKLHILLTILLFCGVLAHAQESHKEIRVDFRVNKTVIDTLFSDNATRVHEIVDYLNSIRQDSTITVLEVSFCGAASPEGSYQINRKLARARLESLEALVRSQVEIPDSVITRNDSYIPWEYLIDEIKASEMAYKDEILNILTEDAHLVDYYHPNTQIDERVMKLKKLDGGKVWQELNHRYFKQMRNASAVFFIYKRVQPIDPDPVVVDPEPVVIEPVIEVVTDTVAEQPVVEEWTRRLLLKTNAVGLGMGISNAAVEIDLAKHWSLSVPIYYSAMNYFVPTVKFRTLGTQPEIRFWIKPENKGFFVAAHAAVASYNIAVDGDLRYQDHKGETPAWGGGLNLGYSLPISKDNRWGIEFTLGAGVYSLLYDTFYNVENGKYIDTHKQVYWGLDNVAVTFSYAFDLPKKGGKQ